MLIELSQSSAFTSCCSFLARLRVIAPSMAWAGADVVGVEVGVELEGACLVGMSSSVVLPCPNGASRTLQAWLALND